MTTVTNCEGCGGQLTAFEKRYSLRLCPSCYARLKSAAASKQAEPSQQAVVHKPSSEKKERPQLAAEATRPQHSSFEIRLLPVALLLTLVGAVGLSASVALLWPVKFSGGIVAILSISTSPFGLAVALLGLPMLVRLARRNRVIGLACVALLLIGVGLTTVVTWLVITED